MKKIKLLSLCIILLCSVFCNGQAKNNTRYFQALYVGIDSVGHFNCGTYFLSTNNNYFPTKEDVCKLIINNYKLLFFINGNSLAVTICEFRNKDEWLKWNRK